MQSHYIKWLQAIGIKYYFVNTKLKEFSVLNNKEQTLTQNLLDYKKNISCSNNVLKDFDNEVNSLENITSIVKYSRVLADSANSIEALKDMVSTFDRCDLKRFANKTVFSDGVVNSNIMLIGEAPGSAEDLEGIPFCGESGKLLDNMLSSINLSRKKNIYITNTVFWRPPANRTPTKDEIAICKPFLEKHIALIKPKLIILVGNTAVTSLLDKIIGMHKIRQQYYLYTNKYLLTPIHMTAIFHPAYLLRQPTQKKNIWYDLLKINQFILSQL